MHLVWGEAPHKVNFYYRGTNLIKYTPYGVLTLMGIYRPGNPFKVLALQSTSSTVTRSGYKGEADHMTIKVAQTQTQHRRRTPTVVRVRRHRPG